MKYILRNDVTFKFKSSHGNVSSIAAEEFLSAAKRTHELATQISKFPVNIFEILGMRNLSAFVGELYAASLREVTGEQFCKNPHQDGYPDLLLMDTKGKQIYESLRIQNRLREKGPFSPFENGGVEIKATCGSVPTPAECARRGLGHKPDIGDQRINVLKGYDWNAHHRETNNLVGIIWDFVQGVPNVVSVFFSSKLNENDWGNIIQPQEGGGRTTSVSIMTRAGVRKMYDDWAIVIDDTRYINFLNRYNSGNSIR